MFSSEHYSSVKELSAEERATIESICVRNGTAYDALLNSEEDREIFVSPQLDGMVSFCRINQDVEMLGGICAPKEFKEDFLKSFINFLRRQNLALSTFNVPESDVAIFRKQSFRTTKLGEELVIDLYNHSWSGKKFWKLRTKTNKCQKNGMSVVELKGHEYYERFDELDKVTRDQLALKSQRESLKFFVGHCPPRQLGPRRVFAALDHDGRVDAFVVLLPFANGRSWGLDSFRIRPGGLRNAMLFLIKTTVDQLQSEGFDSLSLGAVPGAGCDHPIEGDKAVIRQFINFTYKHLGFIYDLRGVDKFKSQFRPNRQNLYICCYPDQFTVNGVYAFFKTFGMFDFKLATTMKKLFQNMKSRFKNIFQNPGKVHNGKSNAYTR